MRRLPGLKCLFFVIVVTGCCRAASSQEPAQAVATPAVATPAVEPPLTADRIDSLRKEAEESTDLDDETKKTVGEIYRSAAGELQRATETATRAATYKNDAETVEQQLAEIRQQLDELKKKEAVLPEGALLPELEQALSKIELQLEAQKKLQTAAEAEPKSRAGRRKEIRARLSLLPERLAELKKQIDALPGEEHVLVTTARKTELVARQMALKRESTALENELTKYDAEDAADLIRFQRDLRTQEVATTERHLELLKAQIKKARTVAADQAVAKARSEAIEADPVLEPYAERNRHLTELTKSTMEKFNAADRDLKSAKALHEELVKQFEQTRQKVELVGLSSAVGALLRKQRAALPDLRKLRTSVSSRSSVINETQYELFEYDDERQELANPEALVAKIVAGAKARRAEDREWLAEAADEVLDRKREYLDALIRSYNQYFDTLVELDTTQQQIVTLTRQYQQYIDERVMWIRSGNLLTSELQLDQSDAAFISGDRWIEAPQRLGTDLRKNPVIYGLAALLLAFLVVRGKRFRRELRKIGESAQKPTCRRFAPTARSCILTVAVASLWPGLVAFLGWRLNMASNGSALTKAVAQGLTSVAAIWFPLELFRQICRGSGLAEAHFAWPTSATRALRQNLRWLVLFGLPLAFVVSALLASDPTHGRDAIERVCFILQAAVLAIFLRRVLRPDGGVLKEYIAYHQGGWIDRLKHVWYWAGVALPMSLAVMAFWGYYYTAQVLSWRLYATMCFFASLILARALLLRLILLRRRNLSIEQARERAAAAQAGEQNTNSPSAGIVTEQPQEDLSTHSVQTQRLLTTGMLVTTLVGFWLIWVEVLPALSMLDQWPLWTTTSKVQVIEPTVPRSTTSPTLGSASSDEEPTEKARTEYHTTSVTFSNVALAMLIAVITFVSARNVPGLLEMSVLQRLPLDSSVRYAIKSLVSYAIVLIGVIVACSNIGLRWSQIQWLATALTFGLAFGLQEIFANFVAGLIILFERPVRVGDVVTVDDVTGVVSRIRIRATSITNWDRKEYVVPNKEFITGRLLNWTLSDKVNRIVFAVGIAYGSDTERARELLLKAASDHPLILKDPPSLATFEGFGDSSLNFTLRTFLPSMENRLQVIHELHTAIDQAFREAGIEIAFPQRDLHVRSTPEALELPQPQPREEQRAQQDAA